MALIRCPECGKSISDKAKACPSCGYPLVKDYQTGQVMGYFGYEYRSSRTLYGLPLVHIAYGPSPAGGFRVAKGIIAIGNIAVGVFAIGGLAAGVFAISGIGLGLICLAGVAFGILLGLGGIATGYIAIGGMAIGVYAIGGLSIGIHTIYNDPHLKEMLKSFFGKFR